MKLFNNFKKTTVKYFVKDLQKIENVPKGIYSNIEKYSNIIHQSKCPAVAMTNNRFYYVNSYLNIDIEFGVNLRTENGADIDGYIKKTSGSKSKLTDSFLFNKKDKKDTSTSSESTEDRPDVVNKEAIA